MLQFALLFHFSLSRMPRQSTTFVNNHQRMTPPKMSALDPAYVEMLNAMEESDSRPFSDMTPDEAREQYLNACRLSKPVEPGVDVENSIADGHIPIRIYRVSDDGPAGTTTAPTAGTGNGDGASPPVGVELKPLPAPCVIYFHGGGFVLGDLDTHDGVCTQLARAARCTVISVDYRRPPEHRFPIPVRDCLDAARWIGDHAGELLVDGRRLAVAGDSAGGNLAAAVCLMARREGRDLGVVLQLLVYPITDYSFETKSFAEFGGGEYLLSRETMRWFWDHYLGPTSSGGDGDHDDERRRDPLVSPLREKVLSGLPPACVLTAGYDVLRDEGEDYAKRLSDAGVPTELRRYESLIHGFYGQINTAQEARDALSFSAEQVKKAFEGNFRN